MKTSPFTGTGVALITPLKNGEVDYKALGKIIDHCIDGGVDYLVSLGTTGETPVLTRDEQSAVLRYTTEHCQGRVPVVAGFGGNDTRALIEDIQHFELGDVAAILSSSPAYNKPSQKGIIAHYTAVADAAPKPLILYNVPGRTCSNIAADTTLQLAEHPNIIGIKEASGNLEQATEIIRQAPSDFLTLSGDDPTALAMVGIGGHGVISVIANALPAHFSKLIRAALDGNFHEAQKLNNLLFPLHKWLYIEGNPVGIKEACRHLGLCGNELRLPLVSMSPTNSELLLQALKSAVPEHF